MTAFVIIKISIVHPADSLNIMIIIITIIFTLTIHTKTFETSEGKYKKKYYLDSEPTEIKKYVTLKIHLTLYQLLLLSIKYYLNLPFFAKRLSHASFYFIEFM